MNLEGALVWRQDAVRVVPHGRLHDQYQRGDVLCPGLLSFAAGVIGPKGFRVEVRDDLEEFERLLDCSWYWVARSNWRDLTSPYLVVREPVPWEDIPWLIRECEMTILAWLRAQNDPEAWEIPGLKKWLKWRDEDQIERLGREEYARQYRRFWNRDLGD